MPLIDSKGAALSVPVYIGLKGGVNLDNKVTKDGSSFILVYHAKINNSEEKQSTMKLQDGNGLNVFLLMMNLNSYQHSLLML